MPEPTFEWFKNAFSKIEKTHLGTSRVYFDKNWFQLPGNGYAHVTQVGNDFECIMDTSKADFHWGNGAQEGVYAIAETLHSNGIKDVEVKDQHSFKDGKRANFPRLTVKFPLTKESMDSVQGFLSNDLKNTMKGAADLAFHRILELAEGLPEPDRQTAVEDAFQHIGFKPAGAEPAP